MENEHHLEDNRLPACADPVEVNNMANPMESAPESSGSTAEGSSESREATKPQRIAGNLLNEVFVYRQDVVKCSKYEGVLGVVMEVAGDSDSEGSFTDDSDSGDDEDGSGGGDGDGNGNGDMDACDKNDKNDSLPDGQVRVMWTDGSETTDTLSDITVVDRGFLHGDAVASVSDPTGQLGVVVDVSIMVDLLDGNGEVIHHVSSRDLKRVREFTVGDYVVHGPWLGRVDDVLDNVTVLFDDGSVCKVVKADPLRLKPVSRTVIDDASCPYYPGQRVKAVSSSVFKSSRWLSGLWKANRLEGTVIKVQAGSVVVYWIASAFLGTGTNSAAVPSEEQNSKKLIRLSCFSHANWQLGDWCLLPLPPLPFSSSANEAARISNLTEPINGCVPDIRCSKEQLISECTDIHMNAYIDGSGLTSNAPDLFLKAHQTSDSLNPEAAIQDETIKSSHVIRSNALSVQLNSEQLGNGCSADSLSSEKVDGKFQSHSGNSVNLDSTTNLDEISGTESKNILLECGACSTSLPSSKEPLHEGWPVYRKKLRKVLFKKDRKARRRYESFERALCIVNITTKVDVAWQDGTREFGLDSKSLIQINSGSDHEFFPEQYVVEKASNDGDDSSETTRVGIVRTVNSKERMACVRWLKPVSRPEDSREFDNEEVVSAYELDEHPDYDYCYGDVVVRLSPLPDSADTTKYGSPVGEQEQQGDAVEVEGDAHRKHAENNEAEQASKDESSVNFTCLSWVGNITGFQDGDIEVTWADGMVSKVGPQAVYVVGRDDDGESFGGGSEASDDAASWETVDENERGTLDITETEADLQNPTDNTVEKEKTTVSPPEDSSSGRNGPLSMSLSALGFVTRLASGLFSRGRKQLDLSSSDHSVVNEAGSQEILEASEKEAVNNESGSQESDPLDGISANKSYATAEGSSHVAGAEDAVMEMEGNLYSPMSVSTNADCTRAYNKDDPCSFKHFDIAANPLDHCFLGGSGQSTGGKKWAKKVHQEWSILEKNLPDAIYVKVFEDRMDLLRAVIIGACGTPYQDGLFLFDFHLPPEYPQVPPSVYYHSSGLRVNPNLYADGKVCLSLLNTWTGKGNEVWDSSSSSILQVLVSLQGLVLNSRPYFNEAGYDKQVGTVEGEKNSLPYNENTYLLNLKSMLYLLRRPPMHFEGFIKDHFRRRGHYILKACEAYMKGCSIGSLTKDACMTDKSMEHSCSTGFKLMLAKTMPRLISALSELGVDCQQFENLQKS